MNASELAQLAAILAHGRTIDREVARALVNQARKLLDAAKLHIESEEEERASLEETKRFWDWLDSEQAKLKPDLPGAISLRRFLRLQGYKSEADGAATYRKFLEAEGVEDIEAVMERNRTQGIRLDCVKPLELDFEKFRDRIHSERASKAAKAKQAKLKKVSKRKGSKKVA
jgi:hypothetical protein